MTHASRQLDLYLHLGRAYRLADDPYEAIGAYETATELDPDNLTAWTQLVVLYSETGQVEEAQAAQAQVSRLTGGPAR